MRCWVMRCAEDDAPDADGVLASNMLTSRRSVPVPSAPKLASSPSEDRVDVWVSAGGGMLSSVDVDLGMGARAGDGGMVVTGVGLERPLRAEW